MARVIGGITLQVLMATVFTVYIFVDWSALAAAPLFLVFSAPVWIFMIGEGWGDVMLPRRENRRHKLELLKIRNAEVEQAARDDAGLLPS